MIVKETISKYGKSKIVRIVAVFLLAVIALYLRLACFSEKGGDPETFTNAVDSFLDGKNIYNETVKSYSQGPTDDHGYAYFPTLLYIYTPLYLLSDVLDIDSHILFKIPILIADILVGILIFKTLYKEEKNFWIGFLGLLFWSLNPHLIITNSYTHSEPLGILFMLLALQYLEDDDLKAGLFYAVSFSLKSFSLVLFPLFILKSKNRIKFLLSGLIFAVLISIPFMRSFDDFVTYIQGSILVHGYREAQGRPFLAYVSVLVNKSRYYVMLSQPIKYLSLILGSAVSFFLYFKNKITDKYVMAMISMFFFYLLTPVLMRTYLIWFMPIYAIGVYRFLIQFNEKIKKWLLPLYSISIILFWGFYALYLSVWEQSFWFTENGVGL